MIIHFYRRWMLSLQALLAAPPRTGPGGRETGRR